MAGEFTDSPKVTQPESGESACAPSLDFAPLVHAASWSRTKRFFPADLFTLACVCGFSPALGSPENRGCSIPLHLPPQCWAEGPLRQSLKDGIKSRHIVFGIFLHLQLQ